MAYDEKQAERIRKACTGKQGFTEKKMFGGIAFMHRGNMCLGIIEDRLVVRTGPEQYQSCLKRKYVTPMDFTGRPMKGFIYVLRDGYKTAAQLSKWLTIGLNFTSTLPKK